MADKYKGYRVPKSIIGYAVRQYHRYKLSLRDVSEMLLEQGIEVTYETIRKWCKVWGPVYARTIRQRRGCSFKDKWHVDEVRVTIKGEVFWLWRLIDSLGEEIEVLLQKRRNARAAIRFLKMVPHPRKSQRLSSCISLTPFHVHSLFLYFCSP